MTVLELIKELACYSPRLQVVIGQPRCDNDKCPRAGTIDAEVCVQPDVENRQVIIES
jgi:hypothetical protein